MAPAGKPWAAGASFHLQHATQSRVVKGEDVLFVHPLHAEYPKAMLYIVCDGHSGAKAAQFVASNYHAKLCQLLPRKMPADLSNAADLSLFAKQLRSAMCEAFIAIDNDWRSFQDTAGTTVTVMLVTGPLVTVANVGDSAVILDTGCSMLELTRSHRIHTDAEERSRLKAAGCSIAPIGFHLQGPAQEGEPGVGPLRIWPGGLCVSRSVGDTDAGPHVVPIPHVKQVLIPKHGCRIIAASDGLWDAMSYAKAVSLARRQKLNQAITCLVDIAALNHRVVDDTSIVMVDILPGEGDNFPSVAKKVAASGGGGKGGGGGLFACLRLQEPDEPDAREVSGLGHLSFYADVDFLTEDPTAVPRLKRTMLPAPQSRSGARPHSAARATPPTHTHVYLQAQFAPQGAGAGAGVGGAALREGFRGQSLSSNGATATALETASLQLRDSPLAMSWHSSGVSACVSASGRVLQEQHSGALVRMLTPSRIHAHGSGANAGHHAPGAGAGEGSKDPSTQGSAALSGSLQGSSSCQASLHGGAVALAALQGAGALQGAPALEEIDDLEGDAVLDLSPSHAGRKTPKAQLGVELITAQVLVGGRGVAPPL